MRTFGIEEEFFLIRPDTGYPADLTRRGHEEIVNRGGGNERIHTELLACQLETSTPVLTHRDEAILAVSQTRSKLNKAAHEVGLQLLGLGTPPQIRPVPATVSAADRYYAINEFSPGIAAEHYIAGTHVHVGVEDQDAGVVALNSLRPWLPLLTALGANSPYWRGIDSGFASWRTIQIRRWSVQGIPPYFAGTQDYLARMDLMLASDVLLDAGHIGWGARLSTNFPTVEVRVADAQLSTSETILLALVIRALVSTGLHHGPEAPTVAPEAFDLAHWQAAKFGIQGNHYNLRTGTKTSTAGMLEDLMAYIKDALVETNDLDYVQNALERIMREGNGAMAQRRFFHTGGFDNVLAQSAIRMLA
ncbi:carboxylate-amine ligase [Paeniglutamicibacter antarcticus]|uniref:Putative glutamate--cysteine ligase 2 n=1 Tax=Paeniglutamicibacter antarcticus TaxID=494023 RepID=A0ABP9TJP4_9MICC